MSIYQKQLLFLPAPRQNFWDWRLRKNIWVGVFPPAQHAMGLSTGVKRSLLWAVAIQRWRRQPFSQNSPKRFIWCTEEKHSGHQRSCRTGRYQIPKSKLYITILLRISWVMKRV